MDQVTLWDHLFAISVFIVYPIYAWRSFPALVRRVREEGEAGRVAGYRGTILTWIGFAALLAVLWLAQGRSWGDLGLRLSSPGRLAAGLALAVALLVFMALQWRQFLRTGPAPDALATEMGEVAALMPASVREERWFLGVSVNAGVTEELIYRGFLFWYLEPFVGPAVAAVLLVVSFTAGHAYQGRAQLPGIAFVSTALVAVYLVSGSLLPAILGHAAVDLLQGRQLARWQREHLEGEAS